MSSSWIPEGITREEIMISYLSNGQILNIFHGFKGSDMEHVQHPPKNLKKET